MDTGTENAWRVKAWLDAINAAIAGPGIETLSAEYHSLFRPDAVLTVPGDTKLSGRHVGFEGWLFACNQGFEIASDGMQMELEHVIADASVCAAILHYTWDAPGAQAVTRATELRFFGDDGLVYEGEFMASDWRAFEALFK